MRFRKAQRKWDQTEREVFAYKWRGSGPCIANILYNNSFASMKSSFRELNFGSRFRRWESIIAKKPQAASYKCVSDHLRLAACGLLRYKKNGYSTFVIFKTLVGRCRCTGVLPVLMIISPARTKPLSLRISIWSSMISSRLSSSP